jgi:hypothetical protein
MKEIISNIYKKRYRVKNTDVTKQKLLGQLIDVGETVITDRPPKESYSFSVKPVEEKKKTKIEEE